jgi:hypothetical protein
VPPSSIIGSPDQETIGRSFDSSYCSFYAAPSSQMGGLKHDEVIFLTISLLGLDRRKVLLTCCLSLLAYICVAAEDSFTTTTLRNVAYWRYMHALMLVWLGDTCMRQDLPPTTLPRTANS